VLVVIVKFANYGEIYVMVAWSDMHNKRRNKVLKLSEKVQIALEICKYNGP